MSFIWTNSTKSGLCDRLIDLFIISSYAKLLNKTIYLKWEEQPINDIQRSIWNSVRFNDYKIENVKQYFQLPECINILSNSEFEIKINNTSKDDIIFNNYLGGVYSPITFYERFIDNKKYNIDIYLDIFNNLINEFKPTKKMLKLILYVPNNLITVHLRRTDKSSKLISAQDSHGTGENTKELNDKTISTINILISAGYNNFYFSSDCVDTKKEYEDIFKKNNIINYETSINIEQTYIDIYIMSISKYIILSQKHSSFSLFSSLINKSNLIYLYDDDIINNNKYFYFKNIIYYKNIENLVLDTCDFNYKNFEKNEKNNNGLLYFHQGWTDIINCLGLINYYCEIYENIYLLIRKDSLKLINFYTKNIKNLNILYEDKNILDNNNINNIIQKYKLGNIDMLLIGWHDVNRNDYYKNKFNCNNFFVKSFYECYDIEYINRVKKFIFTRNLKLENDTFDKFVKLHGNNYILYHEVIQDYDKSIPIINLNGISETFFDMIKVLENAVEIHLLDSVWGAFVYQLDAKYNLFKNKKIILYAKRGYEQMFKEPISLINWKINN